MPTTTKAISYTGHKQLADSIVLKEESKTTFINLLECHMQKLKPADAVEAAIVEEMAVEFWRMSRRYAAERFLLDPAANTNTPAESAAAESRLLARYEVHLRRKYNQKLQLIRSIRRHNETPNASHGHRPNEPTLLLRPVSTAYRTNPGQTISPEVPTNAKRN
jgi:hypothetical protein